MGTKADFYIGKGKKAKWLGSINFDGYSKGIPKTILKSTNKGQFRARVLKFLQGLERGNFRLAKDGWPYPWRSSHDTDYTYIFVDGKVWASKYGQQLFDPFGKEPDELIDLPVMGE